MNDLYRSCRLCFVATGVKEVTSSPELLKAIRDLYDVEVGPIMQINWKIIQFMLFHHVVTQIKETDKYSKLVCEECLHKADILYWHTQAVISGQRLFAKRLEMAEQVISQLLFIS